MEETMGRVSARWSEMAISVYSAQFNHLKERAGAGDTYIWNDGNKVYDIHNVF